MKNIYRIAMIAAASFMAFGWSGCTKKLDLEPSTALIGDDAFATPDGYRSALAKCYGSFATTGNNGPVSGDLPTQIISDAGNSDFYRNYWYMQCLTTDEAGWTYSGNTDPIGIHQLNWTSVNFSVKCIYYRSFYVVTLCNNFITEASDDQLTKRGITGKDASDIRIYREEARLIRAYHYWILMDLFGNPPLVTEKLQIGSGALSEQVGRPAVFNYIESELIALAASLPDPRTNEYGRVDKAAAWGLLSRLYLNAETYIGTPKYSEAIAACNNIINAGYSLESNYKELMLADNHLNTNEFIWALRYDGQNTQTYGGTTFLVHGPSGVTADSSGSSGTWNCIRITQQFVGLFDNSDIRGQFYTDGQDLIMTNLLNISTDGYSSTKFRNKTRTGAPAPNRDNDGTFSDIDLPLIRLAEIYLTYAESVLRGGSGGDNGTALGYLQALAVRARPSDPNAAAFAELTLPYILAERGRELFWEGHRRTDLIRFDQFTTASYLWAWKGGIAGGTAVDSKYKLFPIPADDLAANPTLVQNPGY